MILNLLQCSCHSAMLFRPRSMWTEPPINPNVLVNILMFRCFFFLLLLLFLPTDRAEKCWESSIRVSEQRYVQPVDIVLDGDVQDFVQMRIIALLFVSLAFLGFVSYDNPQCAQQGNFSRCTSPCILNDWFPSSHPVDEWISNRNETIESSTETSERLG